MLYTNRWNKTQIFQNKAANTLSFLSKKNRTLSLTLPWNKRVCSIYSAVRLPLLVSPLTH